MNRGDFGFINFFVLPTAKGFHVDSNEDDSENFATLDSVAKYTADRDYEAESDL